MGGMVTTDWTEVKNLHPRLTAIAHFCIISGMKITTPALFVCCVLVTLGTFPSPLHAEPAVKESKPGIYASAAKTIDKVYVYSPQWLLLINDYMDETEALIYADAKQAFDDRNKDLLDLETTGNPNWPRYKQRALLWKIGYEKLSTQHIWMKNPANFTLSSPDDPNYRQPVNPEKVSYWANSLGTRDYAPDAPLRECFDYVIGHCAYLKWPFPLQCGKKYTVQQADGRRYEFIFNDTRVITPAIKVNQVGYLPDAPKKYAYLGEWIPLVGPVDYSAFRTFQICDATTHAVCFEGKILLRSKDTATWGMKKQERYSGEDVYEMDFTAFSQSGAYYIRVPGMGRSYEFIIDKNALGEAFYTATRGFFHQRSGCALESKYTAWTRNTCHHTPIGTCKLVGNMGAWRLDDGSSVNKIKQFDFEVVRQTADTNKTYDVWGGWHDAADYDRRNSHHVPVWDLLLLYDLNPTAFTDGQLNLPESGNGIPDLLDEARYGIDVWKRSQQPDGSVSGRIETFSHPQHKGMPDKDTDPYFLSLPDRVSTMYYAASASMFARLVKPFNPAIAAEYLATAEKAYQWANNPAHSKDGMKITVTLQGPTDKTPTPKTLTLIEKEGDHDFQGGMAAANLAVLTGNKAYISDLNTKFGANNVRYFKSYPNYNLNYAVLYELASLDLPGLNPEIREKAKTELVAFANEAITNAMDVPYRHSWREQKSRRWGGAVSASWARYLILAWKLTGEEKYRLWALLNADFLLGCNPLSLVQTTGIGDAYIPVVQDQETRRDGILDPVPGITPYGIITTPFGVIQNVVSMNIPDSPTSDKVQHRIDFLDKAAYNAKGDLIVPLWRAIGPHGYRDPLCNEFTVQETIGPVALMLGAFLDKGWMPSDPLKNRQPRKRNEMNGFFWAP